MTTDKGSRDAAVAADLVPRPERLDLAAVRERLDSAEGPEFWRTLEEVTGSEGFEEMLHREFPRQAAVWPAEGVDRRRFLQLAGASMALGGLTGCTIQPPESIVPYVDQPEQLVPGRPLFFASALTRGGLATGVLVESHMGRPTKIEGNPDHPASLGASDAIAQATILQLYDPDRSRVLRQLGRIRSWNAFLDDNRSGLQALAGLGEARIRILTETVTSPSTTAMIRRLLAAYPAARWHQYEPTGRHAARAGARAAFGEAVDTRYDLSKAEVVVALDADFLADGPGSLRHARDFMARRRVRHGTESMSRYYAVECVPTASASVADHRLALTPARLGRFAVALAAAVGVPGLSSPADLDERTRAFAEAVATDLREHRGAAVVIPGEQAAPDIHVLAHAINAALGAQGETALVTDPVEAEPIDQVASIGELARDMAAGEVDVLLVLGGNPVYDAPADLGFPEAMLKVSRKIRLGLYEDETSRYCEWHVPMAHELESWGDARSWDGTITLQQPLLEPLYDGKTATELLSVFLPEAGEVTQRQSVEDHWRAELGETGFETAWRRALHDGFLAGTALTARTVPLRAGAAREASTALLAAPTDTIELALRPDPTLLDGRWANNGWLQECPKPLTKLTWDNAALVAPALAERLGLATEDVARVTVGERSVEVPVWVLPGHPDGSVTLHLGHGRTFGGRVAQGVGVDVYPLFTSDAPRGASGVSIEPTGRTHRLASTQMHSNIEPETEQAEKRHLVRVGTLGEFREDPEFAHHKGHALPDVSLYPEYEYEGHAWGLAVDLSACTGCNACVVACQSENNIPVVGREQVLNGREMHWIRIDRYYQGDLDDPKVHHQPVMCMHCEQAPCEVVCPVAATVHSSEGLNDMVYNRCVGTRYCSNNCPYKVRRFNFLKYTDHETPVLKMMRNPDVTVRTRGVMEKCTYCVQRINHARIDAKREDRRIRDGEVVTACQQACPTGAIVFGDINDPESRVTKWKEEPLNYGLLDELNTRPCTTYLAKVKNPNPALEEA